VKYWEAISQVLALRQTSGVVALVDDMLAIAIEKSHVLSLVPAPPTIASAPQLERLANRLFIGRTTDKTAAVTIFLVRHAKAGSRSRWSGDDTIRPLEADGEWQANEIASKLVDRATGIIASSPYLRCRQTVEPLARKRDVDVVTLQALNEGAGFVGLLDVLAVIADGSVLCSHGDVIPETIDALVRRGARIIGEPDIRKGSIWELERVGTEFTRLTAIPPPRR
jgi:8-oxo-dGTP diphosphatase